MAKDINFIAQTNFRGSSQKFGIRRNDRRQHMYVIGKTGTGKTQFLKNMAMQDIENGEGLAVIDPHGEFVEEILESVPRHRLKDVVYFNPADMDWPVSFNIMDVKDPRYKHLIASGLIGIFTKIWANVWSARMEYILANSILALLDTPGTTLLGIPRMLVDRDYRQKIINNLKDPVVKSFWINEYEEWESRYRNEAIAPVQNKVGQFLNVSFVRNIVGQAKNTIDIEEIMDSGKILLVNVSKGRIGEDNSAILGAMLITKIQLSAMERVRIDEENRRDFYLYVDEFQNFATDSFSNILSEARKYRLNLIMAHQYIGQLVTDTSTAVRDAVFGNVGTMVSFRVGAEDAEFLEKEFTPEFLQDDLIRLANRDVYTKLMIGGITSRPFSAKTITIPLIPKDDKKRDEMIWFSRSKYSRSKEAVENEINRWAANMEITLPSGAQSKKINLQKGPSQSSGHLQQDGTTLYDATCSNCGKATKVIFPPVEGRKVYCKSCLKKIKPEKNSVTVPAKQISNTNEIEQSDDGNAVLADLGIEFGSQKKAKLEQNQPAPKNWIGKKKEVNLTDLKKALDESLKTKELAPQKETAKKEILEPQPQVLPKKEEPKKIENINFSNKRNSAENNQEFKKNDSKIEINLAELRKSLQQLTEEKAEKVNPPLPAGFGEAREIKSQEKVEPKIMPEIKPEVKLEIKSETTKPEVKLPEIMPIVNSPNKILTPEQELKNRIDSEKMKDDAMKMLELGIDIGSQKGEIKPGQTIKLK